MKDKEHMLLHCPQFDALRSTAIWKASIQEQASADPFADHPYSASLQAALLQHRTALSGMDCQPCLFTVAPGHFLAPPSAHCGPPMDPK